MPRLQDRMVLNRYLCGLLGCQDFRGWREVLRDQKEGCAEDGHSYFLRVLEGLQGVKLAPDQLAVLFTEIYLDRLFGDRASLLSELNKFAGQENSKLPPAWAGGH